MGAGYAPNRAVRSARLDWRICPAIRPIACGNTASFETRRPRVPLAYAPSAHTARLLCSLETHNPRPERVQQKPVGLQGM